MSRSFIFYIFIFLFKGPISEIGELDYENRGLIPRIFEYIFKKIKEKEKEVNKILRFSGKRKDPISSVICKSFFSPIFIVLTQSDICLYLIHLFNSIIVGFKKGRWRYSIFMSCFIC